MWWISVLSQCWHWSVIAPNQQAFFKGRLPHHVLPLCKKRSAINGTVERNVVSLSVMVLWRNVPFGFQVNEIYHEESLGVHINVVLVRMIMLGYAKVSSQFQFLCNAPAVLESVWKCSCSQWEREKQEIRFNSLWCIVSWIIWGPIESVFGIPGWTGIRKKALCPNWWLGGLRQWWRQPLRMAIMCTAICCLCTGGGSDPGVTPQWGGGQKSLLLQCDYSSHGNTNPTKPFFSAPVLKVVPHPHNSVAQSQWQWRTAFSDYYYHYLAQMPVFWSARGVRQT